MRVESPRPWGFALKEQLAESLRGSGYEVVDFVHTK